MTLQLAVWSDGCVPPGEFPPQNTLNIESNLDVVAPSTQTPSSDGPFLAM